MEFDFGKALKRELRVDTLRCTSLPISLFDIYGDAPPGECSGFFDLFCGGCEADDRGRRELPCGNDRPTGEDNEADAQKKRGTVP